MNIKIEVEITASAPLLNLLTALVNGAVPQKTSYCHPETGDTISITSLADTATPKKTRTSKKAEPEVEAPAEPETQIEETTPATESAPKVDIVFVRAEAAKLKDKHGTDKLKEILNSLGAKSVSSMDESQFSAFLEKVNALG